MKKFHLMALLLACVLLFCTIPATAVENAPPLLPKMREYPGFTDVKGSWCESAVKTVYETGLLEESFAGCFRPEDRLAPEHLVAACARLHSLLTGGGGKMDAPAPNGEWYRPYYAYLAAALDYEGGTDMLLFDIDPTRLKCTRVQCVTLLADTLSAANRSLPVRNRVTILPDTVDSTVLSFYNAGIVSGIDPYGTFAGGEPLTRAQAAAILARVVDPAQRLSFQPTPSPFRAAPDILGLAPDTVLVTADGYPLTADTMVDLFKLLFSVYWGAMQGGCCSEEELEQELREMVLSFASYNAVLFTHAQNEGYALTTEQRQVAEAYGLNTAGAMGRGAPYHQRQKEEALLLLNLTRQRPEKNEFGSFLFYDDLNAWSEKTVVVTTPAFDALHMRTVYEAIQRSPLHIPDVTE